MMINDADEMSVIPVGGGNRSTQRALGQRTLGR